MSVAEELEAAVGAHAARAGPPDPEREDHDDPRATHHDGATSERHSRSLPVRRSESTEAGLLRFFIGTFSRPNEPCTADGRKTMKPTLFG